MARGKAMAWDVTVPDTFTESHLSSTDTAIEQRAAAKQAADNKIAKYRGLDSTHIFLPVDIKTAGSWSQQAVELVQEIGRRTTVITEDSREITFLFQRLSVALQRGNAVSFLGTFPHDLSAVAVIYSFC